MSDSHRYLHCPHCDHPVIVPLVYFEELLRCRQCAEYYRPARDGLIPGRDPSAPAQPKPSLRPRKRPRSAAVAASISIPAASPAAKPSA